VGQRSASGLISYLFYALVFLVPLVLYPKTSELFEFNKLILTYIFTILITLLWAVRMLSEKRLIFKRSMLDLPLVIFLATQLISTIVTIDSRTSFLGYYSRFHGGFASSLSYAVLYWLYVSNMDRERTKKAIYLLLASATFVSLYAVFQRFGIDKEVWVQDVQNRVFSTLGQPNWLAAWIVALIPLTWALALTSYVKYKKSKEQFNKINLISGVILSGLFFLTLLYTKSRSGLLAFGVTTLIFWSFTFYKYIKSKKEIFNFISAFFIINFLLLLLILAVGTPWTPSIGKIINKSEIPPIEEKVIGPALETGGTESGEIRKIVWKGTLDIFRAYPILGTGVETFAFSYYKYRPVEHNFVSEWDYLYNKAHNEYLNFAATTGSVGLSAYFILIIFSFLTFFGFKIQRSNINKSNQKLNFSFITCDFEICILNFALLSGFVSILVTNFFGFSVVPVALEFFLFPAIAATLNHESLKIKENKHEPLSNYQKVGIFVFSTIALSLLYPIGKYWYADTMYAFGEQLSDAGNYTQARNYLTKATSYSPHEAIYWDELATVNSKIAVQLAETENQSGLATTIAREAVQQSNRAIQFSPHNVNIKRSRANLFINLSAIDANYLSEAAKTLEEAIKLAPTDPKLHFNLGLAYARLGNYDRSISSLEKAVELKPDYRNARLGLGLVYYDAGMEVKARTELEYILEHINPNDEQVINELSNF
jgi:putative inorganic carbon (hco3(-)) transporter